MHTQFDIPTMPMTYLMERGPSCCGACKQGRADCPHPMICGGTLSDDELADAVAEVTQDTMPATLDDARIAAHGVGEGVGRMASAVITFTRAAWRAAWTR